MSGILSTLFWVLCTWAVGRIVIEHIFFKTHYLSQIEKKALSFPLGLGLISLEMALMSNLGLSFQWTTIFCVWLPVAGFLVYRYFLNKNILGKGSSPETSPMRWSFIEKILLGGIIFQVIYAFGRASLVPLIHFDAIANYAVKAKIFYLAGKIPNDFYTVFSGILKNIEYPLMLPLSEVYFYLWKGYIDEQGVMIIFPLFYVCTLILVYCALARYTDKRTALLFTFLLATLKQFSEFATNGYADIIESFYAFSSYLFLFMWIKEKKGVRFLFMSWLCALLSLWTKTEGMVVIAANIGTTFFYLLRTKPQQSREGVAFLGGLSAIVIVFMLILKSLNLPVNDMLHGPSLMDVPKLIGSHIGRLSSILYEYQKNIFGPKDWNILWILFIGLSSFQIKKILKEDSLKYLGLMVTLIFAVYTSIYLVAGDDYLWIIDKTASRFMVQFIPCVIFFMGLVLKHSNYKW